MHFAVIFSNEMEAMSASEPDCIRMMMQFFFFFFFFFLIHFLFFCSLVLRCCFFFNTNMKDVHGDYGG